jgi:hypothetical protein
MLGWVIRLRRVSSRWRPSVPAVSALVTASQHTPGGIELQYSHSLLQATTAAATAGEVRFYSHKAAPPSLAGVEEGKKLPAFEFAVLQAPLMKSASHQLPAHLQPLAARLQSAGGTLRLPGGASPEAAARTAAQAAAEKGLPLVLVVGTGGTEALALEATQVYHEGYVRAHSPRAELGSPGAAPRCALGAALCLGV